MDTIIDFGNCFRNINKDDVDKELLKLTLSLYNNPYLSRKAVDDIIQTFHNFISKTLILFIKKNIEININPTSSEESYLKRQFTLENVKDIFKPFSTEHLRFKMYEEKSLYIPPQLFEIGQEAVYFKQQNKTASVVMKLVYATYVPLLDTFKTFLSVPGTLETILFIWII